MTGGNLVDSDDLPDASVVHEVRETYRFSPVDECIYCGSHDELTDEHIGPLALNGNMILPKSRLQGLQHDDVRV